MDKLEIEKMSEKLKEIFKVERKRSFSVTEKEDGIELNEGYQYTVNGAIPEIADSIAKFAIEIDKMPEFGGKNPGLYFINLITEYYNKIKEV